MTRQSWRKAKSKRDVTSIRLEFTIAFPCSLRGGWEFTQTRWVQSPWVSGNCLLLSFRVKKKHSAPCKKRTFPDFPVRSPSSAFKNTSKNLKQVAVNQLCWGRATIFVLHKLRSPSGLSFGWKAFFAQTLASLASLGRGCLGVLGSCFLPGSVPHEAIRAEPHSSIATGCSILKLQNSY